MIVDQYLQIPCGQTYFLKTKDHYFLEAGDVYMSVESSYGERPYAFESFDHPSDENKRVMTICTMAGCPMNCTFCACNQTFQRKLTAEEIVEQVTTMASFGAGLGRNPCPNKAKEFRVLYTRMGEPMLNAEAVIESIRQLIKLYPKVIIGMSTSGIKRGVEKFLLAPDILPHIDMQFSLHSTNNEDRQRLFGTKSRILMSIEEVGEMVSLWHQACPTMLSIGSNWHPQRISLNMILFEGITYNFTDVMKHFNKDQIWFRLSPWNVVEDLKKTYGYSDLLKTEDVILKKPVSGSKIKQIIEELDALGVTYAYAPAIDEEIKNKVACGQTFEANDAYRYQRRISRKKDEKCLNNNRLKCL